MRSFFLPRVALTVSLLTAPLAVSSVALGSAGGLRHVGRSKVGDRKIPCSAYYHQCVDAEAALCARYGYDPVFKGHDGCVKLIKNHVAICAKERKEKADAEKDSLQSKIDAAYDDIKKDLNNKFLLWQADLEREDEAANSSALLLGNATKGSGNGKGQGALDDLDKFEGYCELCKNGDPSDPFDERAPGWDLICKCTTQFSYVAHTHEMAHALNCGK